MGNQCEIRANNGKIYKDFRAYHIALGHAVRQALLNFVKEIEEYCRERTLEFYNSYNPDYYDRSYQLIDKMRLGELIKVKVQGSFKGKYTIEYTLLDTSELESIDNGYGNFGTYQSFDGTSSTEDIEFYLQKGIYGHESFDLYAEIDDYIDKHLDDRIQKVIDNF